jgi:hypothetical protein
MFPQQENNQKQRPWNKGRLVGPKAAVEAQGNLGDTNSAANR